MRLLIDMNLTPRWIAFLEAQGHEALHWSMAGAPDAKDSEICEYARQNKFIVLTNDLDFPQLLAYTKDAAPGTQTAKNCSFVGQLGKLRAGWQPARAAIANRRAGYHPAPHFNGYLLPCLASFKWACIRETMY